MLKVIRRSIDRDSLLVQMRGKKIKHTNKNNLFKNVLLDNEKAM